MVGSADFNDAAIAGQVNVTISRRQPGSAIKPVLYATAISDTLISPATVLWDIPVTYTVGAGMTYTPVNYDGKFHGPVTARTALANSLNIPAVKLLDGVTVERMLAGARDMGIQSLSRDRNWYGLSLTLGGGEVTLLELTGAFATLANGGQYVAPTPVLAIREQPGQTSGSAGADISSASPGRLACGRLLGDRHPQRQRGAHAHVRAEQRAQAQQAGRREDRHDDRLSLTTGRLASPSTW